MYICIVDEKKNRETNLKLSHIRTTVTKLITFFFQYNPPFIIDIYKFPFSLVETSLFSKKKNTKYISIYLTVIIILTKHK